MSQQVCSTSIMSSDGLKNRSHAAQKYLEKKLTKAKRIVVCGKAWLNAIPTRNTEIVVLFPRTTDDSTVMWLLSRLRSRVPSLKVKVRQHSGSKTYGFYLTTSYSQLLQTAEQIGLKKSLKKELGSGLREFSYDDQEDFERVEDPSRFLSSLEKQTIVSHLLNGLRAQLGDKLGDIAFAEGQAIIPVLLSRKVISQVFPLHDHEKLASFNKSWVTGFIRKQPLDEICEYFGSKIGLYFAWLGHYTKSLVFPALVGLIFFVNSGHNEAHDDIWFVLFSLLNIIWATVYLEFWKRKGCELSFKWGTLDLEEEFLVEPRPLYKGDVIKSPVTGKQELFEPPWKSRIVTYCVGLPITGLCLLVTITTTFLFFEFQEWLNSVVGEGLLWSIIQFLPKILLAVLLIVYEEIYKRIATWVNNKENFRLQETYENHLIVKLTLFHFVNAFSSLFYVAFYLQDINRLRDLLAALLITRQIISNLKEMLLPFIYEKASLLKVGYTMTKDLSPDTLSRELNNMATNSQAAPVGASDSSDESESDTQDQEQLKLRLTQAEVESSKKQYDDAFDDYLEMFVQFGYVTFFSSAFPMAALCALTNNLFEIRSDAFKLCNSYQRPFGKNVKSIGTWQDALTLMSTFAVIINCILIGQSGLVNRMFPNLSPTQNLLLIIILEHVLLAVKFGIAYGIPDVPLWVKVEMAKMEFRRREALKKLEQQKSANSNTNNWTSPESVELTENMLQPDLKSFDAIDPEVQKWGNSPDVTEEGCLPQCNQLVKPPMEADLGKSNENSAATSDSQISSFNEKGNVSDSNVEPSESSIRKRYSFQGTCASIETAL